MSAYDPWCGDINKRHEWSAWVPSEVDALVEYRLCSRCGGMEQQILDNEASSHADTGEKP